LVGANGAVKDAAPPEAVAAQIAAVLKLGIPLHLRNFLAGAIQHRACCCQVFPVPLAHGYLRDEPLQREVVPGMDSRQRTADRRKPLWRIPPISSPAVGLPSSDDCTSNSLLSARSDTL
jgi:hypothetical protein